MNESRATETLRIINLLFEIRNIIKDLPLDTAGHFLSWTDHRQERHLDWKDFFIRLEEEPDSQGLPRIVGSPESVPKLENLRRVLTGEAEGEALVASESCSTRCYVCGERVAIVARGKKLFAESSCQFPGGVPLEFELNVPSGVMVVANDLRPAFSIFGHHDVNTLMGCAETSKAMAKIGCAYASVGNTCPGMFRLDEDRYIIASSGYDQESGDPIEPPGEYVAGIVTDLWWYSIADYNEFKRRVPDENKYNFELVRVKPGVYRFNHFRHLLSFKEEFGKPCVYTEIEWIRPPDPLKDLQAEIMAKNFTAGQVVSHLFEREYFGEMPDAIRFVADYIFCVIGTAGSWHPNGFVIWDPDMPENLPETEIPVFDKPYRWYPLSKYSALCCAAGIGDEEIFLNPSFAILAKNVARCIAEHGVLAKPDEEQQAEKTRDLARQCLEGLLERYPD